MHRLFFFSAVLLSLVILSSCGADAGNHPSYIISHTEDPPAEKKP